MNLLQISQNAVGDTVGLESEVIHAPKLYFKTNRLHSIVLMIFKEESRCTFTVENR